LALLSPFPNNRTGTPFVPSFVLRITSVPEPRVPPTSFPDKAGRILRCSPKQMSAGAQAPLASSCDVSRTCEEHRTGLHHVHSMAFGRGEVSDVIQVPSYWTSIKNGDNWPDLIKTTH
jgi:hypothetical protein